MLRETEPESINEIHALLRLAEQGLLKISEKTGMVSKATSTKILKHLSTGDYYPDDIAYLPKNSWDNEIGNMKILGWLRLLEIGKLFSMQGSKSKLTPAGIKALAKPPHEIIKQIWKKWLTNTKYDEFNRIDEIKGQKSKGHMTAVSPRRGQIVKALKDCPINQWIDMQEFSRYMLGQGLDFVVSRNEWKLYIHDKEYGSQGYDDCGGWNTLEYRFIISFLFEYAAPLGLVDIAYVHPNDALDDYAGQWGCQDMTYLSRYDGLRAFRLTNLGAFCLEFSKEYTPPRLASSTRITVSVDLTLNILSGEPKPAELMLIETWAEPLSKGMWRLDLARGLKAVERGQDPNLLIEYLEVCDDQPVPETLMGFVKNCVKDGTAVKQQEPMVLYSCRDASTCQLIVKHSDLKKLCKRCGDNELVVFSNQTSKFKKAVNALGLGVI
jgi:hypothetical protein